MQELETIREVSVRYHGRPKASPSIQDPQSVSKYLSKLITDDAVEHLVAIYLDSRNQPIGSRIVSKGTATASLVHPREVFQAAILLGALRLIVAHNHPSGNLEPSPEDIEITARLQGCGKLLGIELLDHVIWHREAGVRSLRESFKAAA